MAKLTVQNERLHDRLDEAKLVIDVQKSCWLVGPHAGRQPRADLMVGELTLASTLGAGAACHALGLWRGALHRHQMRMHRLTLIGLRARISALHHPPLALTSCEQVALLDVLNSKRFIDTAPAPVYATLPDEDRYLGSGRTMFRLLAAPRRHR